MVRESDPPLIRAVYGVTHGDLLGLLDLLDEYPEPVAYDLLALGLRLRDLGTDALTWRDLLAVARQAPPGSALVRAQNPDPEWGLAEHLLAAAVDSLNVANWQRSGQTARDYPKPVPRPGVEPDSKTYGSDPLPLDEMAEWLGWSVN